MKEFDFILKFALANSNADPEIYVEKLLEHGCDDALIGIGKPGRIALDFCREAATAKDAIISAISDVQKVIPNAELIEVSPDMVSPTDAANILGCSRQNFRNLSISHRSTFPAPSHEGSSLMLYRLSDVFNWFANESTGCYSITETAREIADANKDINTYNTLGVFKTRDDDLYSQLRTGSPHDLLVKATA